MRVRVAVDAMGGDHAPEQVVAGALRAAEAWRIPVVLVGDERRVRPLADRYYRGGPPPEMVHAPQVISMRAHPVEAVRKQKGASVVVAARLVKEGRADVVVSAGSTGAAMAASLFEIGRLKGVERPAIGTVLPTAEGRPCLLIDSGANADARPAHLKQFGLMGARYAELALGVANPAVGLLSIGEEPSKGSELVVEAHRLLKGASDLNFVGNVEGKDIPSGRVDVVVCDGFVGNVVLKMAEGMSEAFFDILRAEMTAGARAKLGAALLKRRLKGVKSRFDYAEYGGAPLLGLKAICIISHGRSKARAIQNAVRAAHRAASQAIPEAVEKTLIRQS